MAVTRRVWCACVIIDFLQGTDRAKVACPSIIQEAERGDTEIVVSALALAEVVKAGPAVSEDDAERRITEFFERRYVVIANVDLAVTEVSRRLVRRYGIKPLDAVHLATAIFHGIPRLETFDEGLIKLSGKEGMPPVVVEHPTVAQPGLFTGLFDS